MQALHVHKFSMHDIHDSSMLLLLLLLLRTYCLCQSYRPYKQHTQLSQWCTLSRLCSTATARQADSRAMTRYEHHSSIELSGSATKGLPNGLGRLLPLLHRQLDLQQQCVLDCVQSQQHLLSV